MLLEQARTVQCVTNASSSLSVIGEQGYHSIILRKSRPGKGNVIQEKRKREREQEVFSHGRIARGNPLPILKLK